MTRKFYKKTEYVSPNCKTCNAIVISEPQLFQWTDSNDDIKKSKTVFMATSRALV